MREWKPLDTLLMDGRQVEFKSQAGEFEAPARPPVPLSAKQAAGLVRDFGASAWPNVKFSATHWREIET